MEYKAAPDGGTPARYLFRTRVLPGCGMTQEQITQILHGRTRAADDNTSIGLENVLARIRLNFGGKAKMEIESEPGRYTQTTIRLPWTEEEQADDTDPDRG